MKGEVKSINGHDALGFVAFAWTKWHALGIEAFVERLRKNGDCRAGLVMLMPHPTEGYLVNRGDFISVDKDDRVEVMEFPVQTGLTVGVFGHLLRHGIVLRSMFQASNLFHLRRPEAFYVLTANYIPWGALSWLAVRGFIKNHNFKIVYLDEGVGSYMPKAMFKQAFSKERSSSGMTGVRSVIQKLGETYYDYLYALADGVLKKTTRFLFQSVDDEAVLAKNEQVVDDYRSVLSVREGGALPNGFHKGRMALILTGPWSELGHLHLSDELVLVEKMVLDMVAEGFAVVIKPHPREAVGKYDRLLVRFDSGDSGQVTLAEKDVAAEKYMSFMKGCDVVAGFSSTSLVTASALYGIKAKAVSVQNLMDMAASPYMISSSKEFLKRFSAFVTEI